MQWTLAFLQPPTRVQKTISPELDASAQSIAALSILARLIAQAVTTIKENGADR